MKSNLKKNLTLAIITIGLMFPMLLIAQPRGQQGPPKPPTKSEIKKMVTELSTELSLSDEQQTKISKMFYSHFEEVEKSMESGKNKMDSLREDFETEVKTVLTKKQQKQFKEFQKEHQPKQKGPKR